MITVKIHNNQYKAKHFVFSGGEVQTKLSLPLCTNSALVIHADLRSSDDVMSLLQVNDIVDRRAQPYSKHLIMPYIPYARQDRACCDDESIAIKVFANLINSMGFDRVTVTDPHSDMAPVLLNNCVVETQALSLPKHVIQKVRTYTLVCPDAGAISKMNDLAKMYGSPDVVYAQKVRNVATGEIESTEVPGAPLRGKDCLIVDDICDGGRTFIELAKALKSKGAESVHLYVTHGIFSKGLSVFDGLIDNVTAKYNWNSDK